jgi:AraC-like DNA-binding protein
MMTPSLVTAAINKTARDSVDAYDRYEAFVSQNFCKLSYRIDRDRQFGIKSTLHSLDGFMIGRFKTEAGRGDLVRTRAGISEDARGRFALYIPLKGDLELQQFSRTERCSPGSMALLYMEEPFVQRKFGDNDTVYFFMPNDFLDQRLVGIENLCARIFAVDTGVRRLVYDSVISLQQGAAGMTETEFRGAARILGDLIVLALNNSAGLVTEHPSVRTSNLARAKRAIRARLNDPNLTIGDIAKQCGISIRYLHEIFRASGITVSDYLKQQRLLKARQMLESAGYDTTVTDVCFGCGFSNASQFSTAFRREFQVSPRDVLRRVKYWGA